MAGLVSGIVTSMAVSACVMLAVIVIGRCVDRVRNFVMTRPSGEAGRRRTRFAVDRLCFPGVLVHECAHALFAKLSGAKVTKMRCFVLFSKDTLGYVDFVAMGSPVRRAIQYCLISCAPVLAGMVLVPCLAATAFSGDAGLPARGLCAYLAASILLHMSMSRADTELYKKGALLVYPFMTMFVFMVRGLFF